MAPVPPPGSNRPVVIRRRRRKRSGHGQHGGAWKVAYADFVTAMMAFFLLLWLLNVTTSEQRTGIADYFSPPNVARTTSGSGGILGGQTITMPGALVSAGAPLQFDAGPDSPSADPAAQPSSPAKDEAGEDEARGPAAPLTDRQFADALARREAEQFAEAERRLFEAIGGIPELAHLAKNLVVDQTPEGLRIQLVDGTDYSMFPLGGSQMVPEALRLMAQVAKVIDRLPNRLSISGHTDATPFPDPGAYGNWELSSDRAHASRRALIASGIAETRIASVVGRADRQHLVPEQPDSPRNRRISIVLLRERALAVPAPAAPPP